MFGVSSILLFIALWDWCWLFLNGSELYAFLFPLFYSIVRVFLLLIHISDKYGWNGTLFRYELALVETKIRSTEIKYWIYFVVQLSLAV